MAKLVSEGRKHDFAAFGFLEEEIPDPGDMKTFEASKLKWSEVKEGEHAEVLEWTRKLIHLRRSTNALNDGDMNHVDVEFDAEKRWLAMRRGAVRTLVNIGCELVELELKDREVLHLR